MGWPLGPQDLRAPTQKEYTKQKVNDETRTKMHHKANMYQTLYMAYKCQIMHANTVVHKHAMFDFRLFVMCLFAYVVTHSHGSIMGSIFVFGKELMNK